MSRLGPPQEPRIIPLFHGQLLGEPRSPCKLYSCPFAREPSTHRPRDSDADAFGLLNLPAVNSDDLLSLLSVCELQGGGVFLSDWFTALAPLSTYNSARHTAVVPQILGFGTSA